MTLDATRGGMMLAIVIMALVTYMTRADRKSVV